MLDIGYSSGCLTVISNNFTTNQLTIIKEIEKLAKTEWDSFDREIKAFVSMYNLDKAEETAYSNKSPMPKSFAKKYFNLWCRRGNAQIFFRRLSKTVLYHKGKGDKNTLNSLVLGLRNHKMYEVCCNICGKNYFMDEDSITCVKWRSCNGAECLSHTISCNKTDTESVCNIDNNSHALASLDKQLSVMGSLSESLSYYGEKSLTGPKISYISDIHLDTHKDNLDSDTSFRSFYFKTIKRLYDSLEQNSIILFLGDICDDPAMLVRFYMDFVKFEDYRQYRKAKRNLCNYKHIYKVIEKIKRKYEDRFIRLERYIFDLEEKLKPGLDFDDFSKYKRRYYAYESWVFAARTYKSVKSYRAKKLSKKHDSLLDLIAMKLDLLDKYKLKLDRIHRQYETEKNNLLYLKTKYNNTVDNLSMKDIYKEHQYLGKTREILIILGNHDYMGFNSVDDAVSFYKDKLEPFGIKVLQNECYEAKDCIIYGGTGFAKYNPAYNSMNLVGPKNFTREMEVKETGLFEEKYNEAKKIAHNSSKGFVCVSHYPVKDCLNRIDNDVIYFYGHDHRNYRHRNEREIIYADNQVGYTNPDISFKTMFTGLETNPYFSLKDGVYRTCIRDYLQFYEYIGEYIGEGRLLSERCRGNKADLYVIKRRGYYGFFIINDNPGNSKGISVVNGGKTKKISKLTDIRWIAENFDTILYKYLLALTPLRTLQERISKELKDLGFRGTIHGLIVDIDFYHHIALNPDDGRITYYYSPDFGRVENIASFDDVLLSLKNRSGGLFEGNGGILEIEKIRRKYKEKSQNTDYCLSKICDTSMIGNADSSIHVVSRTEGMYEISRRINPLQRLFSAHVLRDFDLRLIGLSEII